MDLLLGEGTTDQGRGQSLIRDSLMRRGEMGRRRT